MEFPQNNRQDNLPGNPLVCRLDSQVSSRLEHQRHHRRRCQAVSLAVNRALYQLPYHLNSLLDVLLHVLLGHHQAYRPQVHLLHRPVNRADLRRSRHQVAQVGARL